MDRREQERTWRLDQREQRWRWELDRISQTRKWDYDRQQREAHRKLDQRREDLERELEYELERERDTGAAPTSGHDRPPGQADQHADDRTLRALGVVGGPLLVLPLAAGHLSAFFVNGRWPSYPMSEVWGILSRLPFHLDDPGAAWEPVNTGTSVPGPFAWWLTLAVLTTFCGLAGLLFVNASRLTSTKGEWASAWEQRRIELRRGDRRRIVVGTNGSRRLGVQNCHSLLVVGPAHAGKTNGLTIPALLDWQGPAVVASTKSDLIDHTIGWRSHQGDVHVFDPAAMTPYHRSGWSPLADCATWPGAIHAAQDLTAAAAAAVGVTTDGEALAGAGRGVLWRSSVAMALAPYLFAAAATGRTVLDAVESIAREEHDEVQEVLRTADPAAAHAHAMAFLHPDPARSAYLRLMRQILSVYEDPVVATSMDRHDIVADELLDGGSHTLYLTAPEHDQARFRPLSATIVRQALAAAYERSATETGPIRPPLLVVLDQVVGIAPVDDLAAVASTGAARGVQIVSIFQSLGQIVDHYGPDTGLLVRNHSAKLVLPSPHDTDPAGEGAGLLPPGLARQLGEGEAALLYGSLRPVRVRLRRWFRDRELRRRAGVRQDALAPTEPDPVSSFVAAEEVKAWHRRGRQEPSRLGHEAMRFYAGGSDDDTDPFGSLNEDTTSANVTPLRPGRSRLSRLRRPDH